jgi:lipopolysaccharide/colanic/teichoic acid biosynthesis glycosyltransferase
MYVGADADQKKFQHLNQADGPVFKIRNDPRFVGIGQWLSNTGLDELPQLLNVLRGDMSLVGPRPLPVAEDKILLDPIKKWRHQLHPGMMSNWIILGAHQITFDEWMMLDQRYHYQASIKYDSKLLVHVVVQQLRALYND